ncbi:MAG: 1-acyl-sn-glycerol-3-phosphate acyltransferase [Cyclobacteriaceae bacterium]
MRVLAIIPSILFYFFFGLTLGLFHPIQFICYHLGGYGPHKRSVDLLNLCLVANLRLLGSKVTFSGLEHLPKDRSLIVVSNHQSMFDIPAAIWGFRHHHLKFISKKELGKGIPSISYNLRKSGALLIDRKKGSKAVQQITEWGQWVAEKNYSACIYPEGTRSTTGQLKPFKPGGLKAIMEAIPDALIVPFVIDGNHKLFSNGIFPLKLGVHLKYSALDPIQSSGQSLDIIISMIEERIKTSLGQ